MATLKRGVKRKSILSKKKDEVVDVESEDDTTSEDEHFLQTIANEDGDSSDDDKDDAVESSDEEDDEVVYETDDGEDEGNSDDSGASSFEDSDDDDEDDDRKENEEDSDSDYSEYGSDDSGENKEKENGEHSKDFEVGKGGDSKLLKKKDKRSTQKNEKIISQSKILQTNNKKNTKAKNFEIKQNSIEQQGEHGSDSYESDVDGEEVNQEIELSEDVEEGEENQSKLIQKRKRKNSISIQKNEDSNQGSTSKIIQKTNKNKSSAEALKAELDRIQRDDEYKNDSSDEEDIRNTVGNIPMNWYDEYKHLGYDWEGKRILKPVKEDEIDSFLKRMEDPNFWRTVKDRQTGQDVVLSEQDVDIIQRLQAQKIPDANFDDAEPWIEWFTSEVMQTPIVRVPDHKRSFLPSKIEARKVAKMVHGMKMGWLKPRGERKRRHGPNFYMLWQSDEGVEDMRRIHNHIPAPKRPLPGHAESYNPPREYLFDKRELKEWNDNEETPWMRKLHFIPQKYDSLRAVPNYERFIKERFERCLDLYLCPRARKMRLTIEPEYLLPQLPNPKDLQPFPTTMSMVFEGHNDMVRSISVEPAGQYLISGSDDLTVKVWEIATGRCIRTFNVGGIVRSVSWCPNQALSLVAVAADRKVLLINPGVGDSLVCSKTDSLLEEAPKQDFEIPDRVRAAVQWERPNEEMWNRGIRIIINHFKEVKQVTWHGRGDYFATVMPEGQNRSVIIHQLSKRRSQLPFNKSKGLVQCVLFHPVKPIFFVATQKNVRVYDLAKQELIKKLQSNSKWISSIAIHSGGDNILVGTYDRKMLWFDLDLSTRPYQILRLHGTAVRGVAYHKHYPLFASASDDRSVIVCHGMVYHDLLQNPLIVPLKKLRYHEKNDDFGVFDVVFHPTQPWVFSSGADRTIRLYT